MNNKQQTNTTQQSTTKSISPTLSPLQSPSSSDNEWTIVNDDNNNSSDKQANATSTAQPVLPAISLSTTSTNTTQSTSNITPNTSSNTKSIKKQIQSIDIFGFRINYTFLRRYAVAFIPLIIAFITFAPDIKIEHPIQILCLVTGFVILGYWTKIKMNSQEYQYIPEQRRDI